jgi:hypothetical protein
MASLNTIYRCFVRLDACAVLLVLAFAALQLLAGSSLAGPTVVSTSHFTNRIGPHSFPGPIPVGDKVQVFAMIDSVDPVHSPTISVEASQAGTAITLDALPRPTLQRAVRYDLPSAAAKRRRAQCY